MKIEIHRVSYEKASTPKEYRLYNSSPVGTLKDYKEMFPNDEIVVYEKCPNCKKYYTGHPALSRKDNKTDICSDCGTKEALEEWLHFKEPICDMCSGYIDTDLDIFDSVSNTWVCMKCN